MSVKRSRDDFLGFLDYLGTKGLIPSATAASRKATANKVLSILSEEESQDVLSVDLEELMRRFENLHRQQYTPESLQTYKSRMSTALKEFQSYCDDPLGFRPSSQPRIRPRVNIDRPKQEGPGQKEDGAARPASPPPQANVTVLPIAIRSDLTVQIAGLPFDLTRFEAQKIANIVLAHVTVE